MAFSMRFAGKRRLVPTIFGSALSILPDDRYMTFGIGHTPDDLVWRGVRRQVRRQLIWLIPSIGASVW